jgi:hypothetical protein
LIIEGLPGGHASSAFNPAHGPERVGPFREVILDDAAEVSIAGVALQCIDECAIANKKREGVCLLAKSGRWVLPAAISTNLQLSCSKDLPVARLQVSMGNYFVVLFIPMHALAMFQGHGWLLAVIDVLQLDLGRFRIEPKVGLQILLGSRYEHTDIDMRVIGHGAQTFRRNAE